MPNEWKMKGYQKNNKLGAYGEEKEDQEEDGMKKQRQQSGLDTWKLENGWTGMSDLEVRHPVV